jgi:tetratricopeptide (TPR) repeat protein
MQIPYVSPKKHSRDRPTIIAEEAVTVSSDVMPIELGAELFGSDSESDFTDRKEGITQPSNPAVTSLSALANQAVSQKDWEKAKSALERALKISPGDASIWRRLAYCYYQTGSYQQALAQAQRASSLSLNNSREQILNRELIGLITKKM